MPTKAKLKWADKMEIAFKQMKAVLVENTMMAYSNHNVPFDIYTDASDYQIGSCHMQWGKQVAYYSLKLTSAQKKKLHAHREGTASNSHGTDGVL